MKSFISTQTKSASPGLATGLFRAAAVASMIVTFGLGWIGPSALGLIGVSGLTIVIATPAQANCIVAGVMRTDIAAGDCMEAQRTGCVRHMLTSDQYRNCLKANEAANASGASCIIGGIVHNEFNADDCAEAKATGCVRRMLSPAQYTACLNAQHH